MFRLKLYNFEIILYGHKKKNYKIVLTHLDLYCSMSSVVEC